VSRVLVCGIPSETPLALVIGELQALNAHVVILNQREIENTDIEFSVSREGISGRLSFYDAGYALESFAGIYARIMDYRGLPELRNEPAHSDKLMHAARVHEALNDWLEIAHARVVNRTSAMSSNASKPYQAQCIRRFGLEIPETLITNVPEAALEFNRTHGRTIYKSISGIRSIVHEFEETDKERLAQIRWCPVQFQQFIEGSNVRVHVVGDRVISTAVRSEAIDYRYSSRQTGIPAVLEPYELDESTAERCVLLTKSLGLAFSGIDLKITADGRVFCFEVNPSPGYSYFEQGAGQPVSKMVATYLAGEG
jgi:glutathione synthase/RimK-type ligase-like ATP-grasp enzyme